MSLADSFVKINKRYENHLTYPMVVGHRIIEMSGATLNYNADSQPITITIGMYNSLIARIEELERE